VTPLIFTKTSSRCHRQCLQVRIRSTRRRRISAANIGPNLFHQNRTDSLQVTTFSRAILAVRSSEPQKGWRASPTSTRYTGSWLPHKSPSGTWMRQGGMWAICVQTRPLQRSPLFGTVSRANSPSGSTLFLLHLPQPACPECEVNKLSEIFKTATKRLIRVQIIFGSSMGRACHTLLRLEPGFMGGRGRIHAMLGLYCVLHGGRDRTLAGAIRAAMRLPLGRNAMATSFDPTDPVSWDPKLDAVTAAPRQH